LESALFVESLDVIIVNWNTGPQLRACLAALAKSPQKGYRLGRVVVVDNASEDQSMDNLACPTLPLVFIENDENLGFAAACNQGAASSAADYLLFLNPDTKVFENTLANSVRWMEEPGNHHTGILGVQLLDEEGQVARTCAKFLATRYFVHRMLGLSYFFPEVFPDLLNNDADHLESRRVDHVTGAYFLIRRRIFEKVHGFDPSFFLYFEDIDLSLRMAQAGWSSYYLASVQCYHAGCGSSNQVKALRLFYSLKSRILYAFKHFGLFDATVLLLVTAFIEPIPRLGQPLATGSLKDLQAVAHAYCLFWAALPNILKRNYRRKIVPFMSQPEASRRQ
jgi:N-acetylglucosaminyl-diphospho-decaprenol L-rhamnosyltransferase